MKTLILAAFAASLAGAAQADDQVWGADGTYQGWVDHGQIYGADGTYKGWIDSSSDPAAADSPSEE